MAGEVVVISESMDELGGAYDWPGRRDTVAFDDPVLSAWPVELW